MKRTQRNPKFRYFRRATEERKPNQEISCFDISNKDNVQKRYPILLMKQQTDIQQGGQINSRSQNSYKLDPMKKKQRDSSNFHVNENNNHFHIIKSSHKITDSQLLAFPHTQSKNIQLLQSQHQSQLSSPPKIEKYTNVLSEFQRKSQIHAFNPQFINNKAYIHKQSCFSNRPYLDQLDIIKVKKDQKRKMARSNQPYLNSRDQAMHQLRNAYKITQSQYTNQRGPLRTSY